MRIHCRWQEKMKFGADCDNHRVHMDTKSPLGDDTAPTPKQLVLAGLCGCTSMDVVALLKKYRQPIDTFEVDADADTTEAGYPSVFTAVRLTFKLNGNIDGARALDAVALSQSKYCGVSAMLSASVPISYSVELNGNLIGTGNAHFKSKENP